MNSTNALSRTILLCRDYVSDEQTDDEIADAFRSLRVLCVADEASASSHSGQTALVTLVSLLSRMGITVGLAVPDVPLTLAQPPFEGDGVRSALLLASGRIMPDASIVSAAASFSPNIVFFLGAEPLNDHTTQSWQMSATEWSGSIGPAHIGLPRSFGGEWPIGAMVSALLAANEAFKCAIRRLRLRHPFHEVFFQPSLSCRWDFGTVATPRGSLKIGPVDFISGGAISQAALFALARVPRLAMRLRAFDDDITERSNLNRNMLTLWRMSVAGRSMSSPRAAAIFSKSRRCSCGLMKLLPRIQNSRPA